MSSLKPLMGGDGTLITSSLREVAVVGRGASVSTKTGDEDKCEFEDLALTRYSRCSTYMDTLLILTRKISPSVT